MSAVLSAERPPLTSWPVQTAIEPTDAVESLTAAPARQERMLTPKTSELATAARWMLDAVAGFTGAGMVRGGEYEYTSPLPLLYPLATPTFAPLARATTWQNAVEPGFRPKGAARRNDSTHGVVPDHTAGGDVASNAGSPTAVARVS